jgi:hypothetical protein
MLCPFQVIFGLTLIADWRMESVKKNGSEDQLLSHISISMTAD